MTIDENNKRKFIIDYKKLCKKHNIRISWNSNAWLEEFDEDFFDSDVTEHLYEDN